MKRPSRKLLELSAKYDKPPGYSRRSWLLDTLAGYLARAGFCVVLAWSLPALAQDETEAQRVFEAGEIAFHDARYADALSYFERVYELSDRPELLYNIALCADRLREDVRAVAEYERYLERVPEAANRPEIEARIRILRRTPGAVARATSNDSSTSYRSRRDAQLATTARRPISRDISTIPPAFYETWWFWTIVGAIVVGGAVGVGLAVSSDDTVQPGDIGGVVLTLGGV